MVDRAHIEDVGNIDWLSEPPPYLRSHVDVPKRKEVVPPKSPKAVSQEEMIAAIKAGTLGELVKATQGAGEPASARTDALLDLTGGEIDIYTGEPPPRDWLVRGVLPSGKSAILAGLGGVSKTQLALELAAAVALGEPFMGRDVNPGKALLLLGEEDRDEISRRFSAIARYRGYTEDQIATIKARVRAFPLVGVDMRLTIKDGKTSKETGVAAEIIAAAKAMGGVELIVLDHLLLLHGGDANASEDAAQTMRLTNRITFETNATVLTLAHSPKSASNSEEADASQVAGSGAFANLSRGAWLLAKMRKDEARAFGLPEEARNEYVSMTGVKGNYGPSGQVFWFKRVAFDEVGLLEHVTLSPPVKAPKALGPDVETQIIELVRSRPGQLSKSGIRDKYANEKDGRIRASKAKVEIAIDDLLARNILINRLPTKDERDKFNIDKRVRLVLDVWRPKEGQ